MTEETGGLATAPPLRVLTLDGGGAKGFYTLGVLKEIEAMIGCPLHQKFDLVFGTSTGAIIASLIALGHDVDAILELYRKYVPAVMSHKTAPARSGALKALASEVFRDATFGDVKTGIGIVTAKWLTEKPMIFKGSVAQAHGRVGTFVPGFGVSIADAVKAAGLGDLDKRKIQITSAIKSVGEHEATVRLRDDLTAVITLQVVAAK